MTYQEILKKVEESNKVIVFDNISNTRTLYKRASLDNNFKLVLNGRRIAMRLSNDAVADIVDSVLNKADSAVDSFNVKFKVYDDILY